MRAALLILFVAGHALAGEPISLSVADETPCVKQASLLAELERVGLTVAESGVLDVDVSGQDGVRLRARRTRDAVLFVRTVPVRRGCEGVEFAVVTLIREWAKSGPLTPPLIDSPKPDAGAVVPPPPKKVVVKSTPTPSDAGVATVNDQPGDAGEELAAVDAGPVDLVALLATIDAGISGVELVSRPPPAPPVRVRAPPEVEIKGPGVVRVPPSHVEIRVALAGGFSSLLETPVTLTGTLVADIGNFGPLGVTLDGVLDGDSTVIADAANPNGGQLTFSTQSLGVHGRARIVFYDRFSFDLGLGARGFRLMATTRGFSNNGSLPLMGIGPSAMLTMWVRLLPPLFFVLRGSVALRLPSDQLIVSGGPTFTLGIWQVAGVAGLSIAWP